MTTEETIETIEITTDKVEPIATKRTPEEIEAEFGHLLGDIQRLRDELKARRESGYFHLMVSTTDEADLSLYLEYSSDRLGATSVAELVRALDAYSPDNEKQKKISQLRAELAALGAA